VGNGMGCVHTLWCRCRIRREAEALKLQYMTRQYRCQPS
jgi:hypothetical protein